MANVDFLNGFIVGLLARMPPPRNPIGIIIGICVIAASLIIATLLAKNLGEEAVTDTSKAIWGISFYVIPWISWLAYYFVVKRGRSISKSGK